MGVDKEACGSASALLTAGAASPNSHAFRRHRLMVLWAQRGQRQPGAGGWRAGQGRPALAFPWPSLPLPRVCEDPHDDLGPPGQCLSPDTLTPVGPTLRP